MPDRAIATQIGRRGHWLWRTADEHGQTPDVLLQERRDTVAAERFFRRLLVVADGIAPARITTDKLGSYAAAPTRLPEMHSVEHLQVGSARRCNNRIEQAHQPTRLCERQMRRFKSVPSAQRFLAAFSRFCNHFRVPQHLLTAAEHCAVRHARIMSWRALTGAALHV